MPHLNLRSVEKLPPTVLSQNKPVCGGTQTIVERRENQSTLPVSTAYKTFVQMSISTYLSYPNAVVINC